MKGTYRALVCSDLRGGWYGCCRYITVTGGRGILILGESAHGSWDQAAIAAIAAARRANQ